MKIFAKLELLNPIAQSIQDIRHNLIDAEKQQTIWTMYGNSAIGWCGKFFPLVFTAVLLWFAVWLFRRNSRKFAEVM